MKLPNFISRTFRTNRSNRPILNGPSTIIDDEHSSCLNIVYEGGDPAIDLVAIHGLGGHWKSSWTDSVTGTFWLRDLLPADIPKSRILSYAYHASESSTQAMEEIAAALLAALARLREDSNSQTRPIVFIAHSFGGPLLKGALAASHALQGKSETGSIAASTYGILFFGVPEHAGDGLDKLSAVALKPEQGAAEAPLMKTLRRDLVWQRESNATYEQIRRGFVVRYFTESGSEAEGGRIRSTLEDRADVADLVDTSPIPLGRTHGQMVRFPRAVDADYRKVSACLVAMVAEAMERA